MKNEHDHVIKRLNALIHLDVDAVHAYQHAIEKIDVEAIRSQLVSFQGDHQRHIEDLQAAVRNLGGEPAEGRDAKGLLIEGMTAMRSALGAKQALKAMRQNEMLTNKTYEGAEDDRDLPPIVRDLIARNLADERRHLAYIEQALEQLDAADDLDDADRVTDDPDLRRPVM